VSRAAHNRLDDFIAARETGALPQNVNYALKGHSLLTPGRVIGQSPSFSSYSLNGLINARRISRKINGRLTVRTIEMY